MNFKYTSRTWLFGIWPFVLAVLFGCEKRVDQAIEGPLSFEVKFVDFDPGSEKKPIPYSTDSISFSYRVRAIDFDGELADWFHGNLQISVSPFGALALGQKPTIAMKKGRSAVSTVAVQRVHGSAALWVEDTGTDKKPGSFAVGLSPRFHVDDPYISDFQKTDAAGTSPLNGDFVQINLKDRRAVVSGLTQDGFYVTDIDDPQNEFNAVYVYTHSRPSGVATGSILSAVSGTVTEYYGFTELGFPSYQVEGTMDVPSPDVVGLEMLSEDVEMEKHESKLVELQGVKVCPIGDDFERYGQWAVDLDPAGTCSVQEQLVNVVSAYTTDWFDPKEHVGKVVKRITGNLRQHTAASPMWIVYTRNNRDIEIP